MGDIRISGLESKIDIADTIAKLVEARKYRLNAITEEQTEVNYDLEAWNEIATVAGDLTTTLDTLRKWETWNSMAATSSDETKLTATAGTSAVKASYNVEILNLAQAQNVGGERASVLTPGGTVTTDLVAAGVLAAGSSFTIEGQTITIGATESLNTLVGKINTAASSMSSDNRVMATILDDRLVIMREKTGATQINMSDAGGTPLQNLGVLDGTGAFANELIAGVDAQFRVNGALITRANNTGIDDVITGVTLNLNGETMGSTVRLTIDNDKEEARAAMLDFIEKYNAMASQCRYFSQKPLTGESASGATIEALGELYNDSLLSEIEKNIRKEATASKFPYLNQTNAEYTYQGKTGVADSLEDMGIWTQGESNELAVTDEEKLDFMLDNHFDLCGQLFRGVFDSVQGSYTHGVATDFYNYAEKVSSSLTGDIARRTKTLEDKLSDLSDKIAEQEQALEDYELMLVEQFTAMETAEAKLNSELDWFKQSFSK